MRTGLTLVELLLVLGLVIVLGAGSFPYMSRMLVWFHHTAISEIAINQLYDTGLVVTRTLAQDRSLLNKLKLVGDTLMLDGNPLQSGVTAAWETKSDLGDVIVFRVSTLAEPVETLRFVVLPIR